MPCAGSRRPRVAAAPQPEDCDHRRHGTRGPRSCAGVGPGLHDPAAHGLLAEAERISHHRRQRRQRLAASAVHPVPGDARGGAVEPRRTKERGSSTDRAGRLGSVMVAAGKVISSPLDARCAPTVAQAVERVATRRGDGMSLWAAHPGRHRCTRGGQAADRSCPCRAARGPCRRALCVSCSSSTIGRVDGENLASG
jgi:hypothetical protein